MKVVEIHWASSPRKRPAHAIRIDEGATICGVNLVYSDPYRTLRVHEGEPTCGQCQRVMEAGADDYDRMRHRRARLQEWLDRLYSRHLPWVEGEHECPACSYRWIDPQNLKDHYQGEHA